MSVMWFTPTCKNPINFLTDRDRDRERERERERKEAKVRHAYIAM